MFSKIFTYQWFFNARLALSRIDRALVIFFGILVVAAVVCRLAMLFRRVSPVTRRLLNRIWLGGLAFGIVGLIWFELRVWQVPILSTRFVASLIMASFLVWLVFFVKYLVTRYSKEKESWSQEQLKNKYLNNK